MDFCHSSCALISKAMQGCSASKWPFEKSACHTCGFVMWVTDLESVNKYILSKYTVELHTTKYGQTHLLDVEIKSLFNRPDNLSFFLFFWGEKRLFIQVLPSIFPNTWSFNYLYKTKSKLIFTKCVVCSLKNIC